MKYTKRDAFDIVVPVSILLLLVLRLRRCQINFLFSTQQLLLLFCFYYYYYYLLRALCENYKNKLLKAIIFFVVVDCFVFLLFISTLCVSLQLFFSQKHTSLSLNAHNNQQPKHFPLFYQYISLNSPSPNTQNSTLNTSCHI